MQLKERRAVTHSKGLDEMPSWLARPNFEDPAWLNTLLAKLWPFVSKTLQVRHLSPPLRLLQHPPRLRSGGRAAGDAEKEAACASWNSLGALKLVTLGRVARNNTVVVPCAGEGWCASNACSAFSRDRRENRLLATIPRREEEGREEERLGRETRVEQPIPDHWFSCGVVVRLAHTISVTREEGLRGTVAGETALGGWPRSRKYIMSCHMTIHPTRYIACYMTHLVPRCTPIALRDACSQTPSTPCVRGVWKWRTRELPLS